jgi:hypothetical protein
MGGRVLPEKFGGHLSTLGQNFSPEKKPKTDSYGKKVLNEKKY